MCITMARRVAAALDANEALVDRMSVLADRKEFSNDPTQAMADISQQFQEGVSCVQADLGRMKGLADTAISHNASAGALHQQQQHHKLLSQDLHKRLARHVEAFQAAVKTHTLHVHARNKRVDRYGAAAKAAPLLDVAGGAAASYGSAGFAMFQVPSRDTLVQTSPLKAPPLPMLVNGAPVAPGTAPKRTGTCVSSSEGAELRRRAGGPAPPAAPAHAYTQRRAANGSGGFGGDAYDAHGAGGHLHGDDDPRATGGNGAKLQQRGPGGYNVARLRGAEKVEAAIAQMGSLFSQMAGLVMEQGEVLQRVEDDVESGLEQTVQAHAEMQYFYELSKSNRSLIVKILLLLMFFALLFLRWF